jgi:hypothetical protein
MDLIPEELSILAVAYSGSETSGHRQSHVSAGFAAN